MEKKKLREKEIGASYYHFSLINCRLVRNFVSTYLRDVLRFNSNDAWIHKTIQLLTSQNCYKE